MSEPTKPEDLLEFPCHYTFKAVGLCGDRFKDGIVAATAAHVAVSQDAIHIKPSAKGNYQSVSIVVRLENYRQLQDIYAGMKQVPGLKMLL